MSNDIADIEARIAQKTAAFKEVESTSSDLVSQQAVALEAAYHESFWLSGMLLTFGLIVVGIMAYLVKQNKDPESLLRSFGTVLVIISAVFLIVAGYSEKQIAPVIGLLGTIAGYLLGKNSEKAKKESE